MRIGILGGGQLGRMLALAGYPLGFRFRSLDHSSDAPIRDVAELIVGDFQDSAALSAFAEGLDVATYEFENIPVDSARWLAEHLPVFPAPVALETSQDRLVEKNFFEALGIPGPRFAPVNTREELESAAALIGLPSVLKTRRFGYDGKGQSILTGADDLDRAWQQLSGVPLLLEEFVRFEREVSIVSVRGRAGEVAFYPLVENVHREGMLRLTRAPAGGTDLLQQVAEGYAAKVLNKLGYVGVLAIEFFQSQGHLMVNEMAPRVHNSGHWSIEGAVTSQFENHLRAIAGMPIGSTAALGASAMVNLIGKAPDPERILAIPGAHLHSYGKEPRPGRKLGHVTVQASDAEHLEPVLDQVRAVVEE